MADPTSLTAIAAIARIKAGELSPDELFDAYRRRIDEHGEALGAFLWLADAPIAVAPASEAVSLPLAGVALAVKDIFCTNGVPTTAASRILEGYVPPYEATAVRRLREAGATMIGKTNMDEFAMGSSSENSAFGVVRNPWDRERVPGGSSGGSAAAVAARLAPWSIGTDTGGSVRQPASLCGIVGLKPTYGTVSRYGMIAFASSLDQCGPLTRNVSDAALLYSHLIGGDSCDSTSLDHPDEIAMPTREDLKGLRFGVPSEFHGEGIDARVREVFDRTLRKIEELGGAVEGTSLPHAAHGISAYYVLAPAEASANLARYDGVRFGFRASGAEDLLAMYESTRAEGFGAEVKRRIMLGTYVLSAGYYEAYYGRAQRVRTKIVEDFRDAFASFDFVVTPTSPTTAFKLGERTADPLAMYMSDYCTVPMSLAGIPAISIPAGLSDELPVGFQIAGPAFSESGLLDAAYALERAIGFEATPRLAQT